MQNIVSINEYQGRKVYESDLERNDHLLQKLEFLSKKVRLLELHLSKLSEQKDDAGLVSFSLQDGTIYMPIVEIIRCEASGNYTTVYAQNQKPILVSMTLKVVEAKIGNNNFVRVHASHLVNKKMIRKMSKNDSTHLILENGDLVAVARSKWKNVQELMVN